MKSDKNLPIVVVAGSFICLVGIWFLLSWLVDYSSYFYVRPETMRANAETIGALFSALAFGGILWSLHSQRQELSLQREELKAQRQELQNSVEAQRASSEALKQRLELEENLLKTRVALDLDGFVCQTNIDYLDERRFQHKASLDSFLSRVEALKLHPVIDREEFLLGDARFNTLLTRSVETLVDLAERLQRHEMAGLTTTPQFTALFAIRLKGVAFFLLRAYDDPDFNGHPLNDRVERLYEFLSQFDVQ